MSIASTLNGATNITNGNTAHSNQFQTVKSKMKKNKHTKNNGITNGVHNQSNGVNNKATSATTTMKNGVGLASSCSKNEGLLAVSSSIEKSSVQNGHKSATNGHTKSNEASLEEQFKAACDAVNNLPKNGPFQPSNEMLLKFYGFYKQATMGPVKTSRPSMFKVVERAKYDAWYSLKDLSKEEAMKSYVDEIKMIIEIMPQNEYVQKFIESIGPFYEFVDEKNEKTSKTNTESCHMDQNGHIADNEDENDNHDNDNDEHNDDENLENIANSIRKEANGSQFNSNEPVTTHRLTTGLLIDSTTFDKLDLVASHNSVIELNGSTYLVNGAAQPTSSNSTSSLSSSQLSCNGNHRNTSNGHRSNEDRKNDYDDEEDDEEEDEDYCDTSEFINDQLLITKLRSIESHGSNDLLTSSTNLIKPKAMKQYSPPLSILATASAFSQTNGKPTDYNHNQMNSNETNGALYNYSTSSSSNMSNETDHHHLSDNQNERELEVIIHRLGGESVNSPPIGGPSYSNNPIRQSRPNSTQSMMYGAVRNASFGAGASAGGTGGGGGGGNQQESFQAQGPETNRQILLILLRLQQDTNNLLTRLSYLESTVMSLQNNLQINRIENSFQTPSAFAIHQSRTMNDTNGNFGNNNRVSIWKRYFSNIDWRTVSIAIIWPFVIRLIFFFLRKVRLVIKLRRVRQ